MNAIAAKQLLWRNEEDFETESLLSQSWASRYMKFISPPYSRIYCSFRTVQQQKSTILIQSYADTGNKDRLYL